MRLAGKVTIVTGAGSGFGEGIAKRFAEEGAKVVVNDLVDAAAERVAREIVAAGGAAHAVPGDVSKDADVARVVATALAVFGDLHAVVNNAGTTHRNKPMLEVSEDEYRRLLLAVSSRQPIDQIEQLVRGLRRESMGARLERAKTLLEDTSTRLAKAAPQVEIRHDGLRVPPGGIVVLPPGRAPFRSVTIDGRAAALTPEGGAIVRRVPARLVFR